MKFAILLLMQLPVSIYAQSLRQSLSFPYLQISAYSSKQNDVFSFTGNQAALAAIKEPAAGVYGERRFMLAETTGYAAALQFPSKMGNFGLQLNHAGYAAFNENFLGLAYGRSLSARLDVGVQFNYYGYTIPAYNKASTVYFEGGVIMHFSENFHGGFHINNPVGIKAAKGTEKPASRFSFGLGLDASPEFYVGLQLLKEENKPVNVNGGFIYQFKKQFFLRGGFTSDNESGFGGAGVSWKKLRLDVSASMHPQLGLSPGLLLIWSFKNTQHE